MNDFSDIPDDINAHISAHIKQYLQDPERAHLWDSSVLGVPGPVTTLLLTTRGRRSGKIRHAPLLYVDNDGSYLIVGSKGGLPTHPLWYLNLEADPVCEIRVGRLHTRARARTLTGEERERLWQKVTARHPVFEKYQARAPRRIPLILLEPIED